MEEGSHCDQYMTDGLVGLLVPSLEPVRSGAVWGKWAGMNLGASAGAVSQGSVARAPCEGVCALHLQGVFSSAWRKELPSGTSS